jgi:hypothetical protein
MSVRVSRKTQVRRQLAGTPAVLLSASIPYEHERPQHMPAREWAPRAKRNREYLATSEPARIRAAVAAITRAILWRGVRLVFGAHPAISPIVLNVARDIDAPAGNILIFQPEFRNLLPKPTLELASLEAGRLVLTAVVNARNGRDHESRDASLALMRKLMVSVPGLRAGIFVGGMEGVEEEAELMRKEHTGAQFYALASTGSGARRLWLRQPKDFSGSLREPDLLAECWSYSVVARRILDDLKIPAARDPR